MLCEGHGLNSENYQELKVPSLKDYRRTFLIHYLKQIRKLFLSPLENIRNGCFSLY